MTAPAAAGGAEARRPLSRPVLAAVAVAAILFFYAFLRLGGWQLERRVWKHDLVARVAQRVHAPAVPAPGPAEWPSVSAARDEYRRVSVAGTFLHDRRTLVQASTVLGSGYWVMTPLVTGDGAIVLVNRGFVPAERGDRAARWAAPGGPTTVTGLLRIAEPGGRFPRRNDPAADRWYSRDLPSIAHARGLGAVAPYFIDADASAQPPAASEAEPVGGLTVTDFRDHHLVYALTWYALAAMGAAAAARLGWEEWRLRRAG